MAKLRIRPLMVTLVPPATGPYNGHTLSTGVATFTVYSTFNKAQLSLTNPRDALHHAHSVVHIGAAQCDKLATVGGLI